MTPRARHPEAQADRNADRLTWAIVLVLMLGSFVMNAASAHDDLREAKPGAGWGEPWLREAASHVALFMVAPIVPLALSRAPIGRETWRWALPAHIGASLVVSARHIALLAGLRTRSYPALLDRTYSFGFDNAWVWLYEYRKDAFTYVLLAVGFMANRLAEQRKLDTETRRADARERGRLSLKCGGRTLFVDASDVVSARAAADYVDVRAGRKTHLARMTLAELERLLTAAGGRHARVHRSHIVNLEEIEEIRPSGQGDVMIILSDGEQVPGSRRDRDRLPG